MGSKEILRNCYSTGYDLAFGKIEVGQEIIVTYMVRNLSATPIKIIYERTGNLERYDRLEFKKLQDEVKSVGAMDAKAKSVYLTKESLVSKQTNTKNYPKNEAERQAYINGGHSIYLYGGIKYINLVTGKLRYYWYVLKLTNTKNGVYPEFAYNENLDN